MTERIGIIGGGIVGIALARALVLRGAGEVTVFEKEQRLATHQTGRNSGVVHAGLYYAPGSLKATLCAAGRVSIREYCVEKGLPYREVGKLVVASDESELGALAEIERRSIANGVPDLVRLEGQAALRDIEPHVAGVAAVHSPHTAAVDYAAITEAMAQDVRAAGGSILLGSEVTAMTLEGAAVRVVTPTSEHTFDRVIACAGLQSDVVAKLVGAGWRVGDPVPHPVLLDVHRHVQGRYGVRFDSFALARYRDGRDGQAFHRDRDMRWLDETVIALLTLGARRPWLLRPRANRYAHELDHHGAVLDLAPGPGDLVVMGGGCQARWEHSVAKVRRPIGERISVQWRWTSGQGRPVQGASYRAPRHYSR